MRQKQDKDSVPWDLISWRGITFLLETNFVSRRVIKSAMGSHSSTVAHIPEQGYLPFPGISVYFSKRTVET